MNFAERLSGLMAERGLSKLALAKKIGVSDRVVGAWVNGENGATLEKAVGLADFFDVSLDYLAGRSDVREMSIKKEPAPEISENGQNFLKYIISSPKGSSFYSWAAWQERYAPVLDTASAEPPAHNAEAV